MPEIAYIILNYRSPKDSILLIKSIRKFDKNSPIIVVDNCSKDDSIEMLEKHKEKLNFLLLVSNINLGYARGNNLGLEYLDENYNIDFVFICNPDIKFAKEQVLHLVKLLKEDPESSIAGIQMLDETGQRQLSAWKLPNLWQDIVISSSVLHRLLGNPLKYKESKTIHYSEVIQGAFFIARFNDFREIGFFDTSTFLYGEERIIGFKLKSKGKKLIFDPGQSFTHVTGASISKVYTTKIKNFKLLLASRTFYHKITGNSPFNWVIFKIFAQILIVEKGIIDLYLKVKAK